MVDARMAAGSHEAEVARLREAYAALPPGAPVRLAKRTSNLFRFRDADPKAPKNPKTAKNPRTSAERTAQADRGLDVSAFGHVLCVDPATRTARVGGMTTYEDLCDATLRHQLMPLVVPQLKTITLGGAVTGLGIESTALRSGMPHESVTEMEILTGDGRVVRATDDNEHADLFRGFPNSYGTLGYSLSLTIELEPVQPFVHIRHFPFGSAEACMDAISQIATEGSFRGHRADFVDGTAFRTNELPHRRGVQCRRAVAQRLHRAADLLLLDQAGQGGLPHHPRLPVALGHRLVLVLTALRGTETPGQEDVAASVPTLGRVQKAGRPRPPLRPLRLRERAAAPAARERVIQDVEIPVERGAEFLRFFQEDVGMSPVWMCPLRLRGERVWPLYPLRPGEVYVNFGFWGTVPLPVGQADGYHNRLVDEVARLDGHKSLYSTSFYAEDEFYRKYNGEAYRALKRAYDGEGRLLGLYEKCVTGR